MPLHVLLPWGAQMLSLLDGAAGDALLPTLKVTPSPRCSSFHGLAMGQSMSCGPCQRHSGLCCTLESLGRLCCLLNGHALTP